MNRLRHAYLQLHPELEPNFMTSPFDDLHGAMQTLGIDARNSASLGSLFQSLVSLPGMLSVIVAADAGAIAGLAAAGFGAPSPVILLAGAVAFAATATLMWLWGRYSVIWRVPVESRFPSPPYPPTS
jgi:hypothetical protein